MIEVSSVLSDLIRNHGFETRFLEHRLRLNWKGIVGQPIASHAVPDRIQHRRLYIWVDSPVWKQQLIQVKPELLMKVNSHLRSSILRDILFKIGRPCPELSEPLRPDPEPSLQAPDINPELEVCIQEYLQPLTDTSLRETVRRTILKSLAPRSSPG